MTLSPRLVSVPAPQRFFIQARRASASTSSASSSAPFPYPLTPNPTPHQIFHLPHGSSQDAIKSRYYDLVRIHHPDSPTARALPPDVCRVRFQSITAAYDILTCKARSRHSAAGSNSPSRPSGGGRPPFDADARWRGGSQYANYDWMRKSGGGIADRVDDRIKDRFMVFIGVLSLVVGFAPFLYMSPARQFEKRHLSAVQNLAEARRDAKEFGHERRREIRRRVRSKRLEDEVERLRREKDGEE